ncbi:hypothetical protein BDF19DRAFT_451765 [Syncephalis fuscata]|nr:hypothetical protein BDF19DRAFT_451765 [Syncephalis fuscata]
MSIITAIFSKAPEIVHPNCNNYNEVVKNGNGAWLHDYTKTCYISEAHALGHDYRIYSLNIDKV